MFNYHIEAEIGAGSINILKDIKNACVVAYSLPIQQSLSSTWELSLYFDNKMVVEFSSICTKVDGWEELGVLKMKVKMASSKTLDKKIYNKVDIPDFCVKDIEYLYFEDDEVYIESGIILKNEAGEQVVIAAGVSPGSVSVKAPFNELDFEPEMEYEKYSSKDIIFS